RGLLKVQEAYAHAASGEELFSRGELNRGRKEFATAMSLAPQSSELKLWLALGLMRLGQAKEARSLMRGALGRGQDLKAVLREFALRGIAREPPRPAVPSQT
ncbi:MAG TPA: tetratricopeptide repeat protein, partial [Nitrososphaerales archaeon]|nr:tetratricopeptide repeat protein [Nitrososphaerales archaeon]